MILPKDEDHKTSEWVLKDKRIKHGKGLDGKFSKIYLASYECEKCQHKYPRFVSKEVFEKLVVGTSRWEWEWVK